MTTKTTQGVLAFAVAIGALLLWANPAASGPQPEPLGELDVTKVVSGSVPVGTTFEIEVNCTIGGTTSLTFPETGGTQTVPVSAFTDCTVTETVDGGADGVSFACQDIPRGTVCAGDGQNISLGEGDGIVTITNTFAEPTPADPPPAVAAEAVSATPTFTG